MRAAVSGRAATAIFLDGDAWRRIDGEEPQVIKPSGPHEWPYLFSVSQDIEYIEAETVEDVRSALLAAVDEEHALSLALICLDMGSEFATKSGSSEHLNEIFARSERPAKFLWRVFTAKELPRDACIEDACLASTGRTRELFVRLKSHQPAIALVSNAWKAVPPAAFGALSADELRAFATHSGLCRDFVEAVYAEIPVHVPQVLNLPGNWPSDQVRQVFERWVGHIAAAPALVPRIEIVRSAETILVPEAERERRTLFSAPDPDLEQLQTIDFHGSLINNLLLRPQLVIPDLHFFTSSGIADHLAAPDSLLEHAIASGLVVVACRFRGADLETAYQVMARQRLVTQHCEYVHRLQRAADANPDGAFVYWPAEGMSTNYERYLAVLQADDPPASAINVAGEAALTKTWEQTREWRNRVIDEAREATRRHGGTGVHKRELFRQLVKTVVGRPAPEITGIRVLMRAAAAVASPLQAFWSWAAEGHRFSRGRMLDALIYSPGYEKVQNLFVTSALGSLGDANPLRIEVELPSTSILKQVPPQHIIELRRGPGAGYFAALQRCRDNPGSRDELKVAIEQYAAEAGKVAAEHVPRLKVKRVELSVGVPSIKADADSARRQQFLAMTTFDSGVDKLMTQYITGGKVGPVTTNKQTDVCVINDLPKETAS